MIVVILGCLLGVFELLVGDAISPIWGIVTLILSLMMIVKRKEIIIINIIGFTIVQGLYIRLNSNSIFTCNTEQPPGSAHMWDSFCSLKLIWNVPIIAGNLIILMILVLIFLRWNKGKSALTKDANAQKN